MFRSIPWFVSSEILSLVEFAAESLPDGAELDDPPEPGIAWFERPIDIPDDDEVDADSLADRLPPDLPPWLYDGIAWDDTMISAIELDRDGYVHCFECGWADPLNLVRFMTAFHLLSAQHVYVPHSERLERARRREAKRAKLDINEVLVVTLRRQAVRDRDADARDVEWSHRWMVSGHWRHRWSERTNGMQTIWINPHVKGPADKPLILKNKVVKFVR